MAPSSDHAPAPLNARPIATAAIVSTYSQPPPVTQGPLPACAVRAATSIVAAISAAASGVNEAGR